jgi:hypothetical protein
LPWRKGRRETAARSARHVLRTFVDWEVLKEGDRAGIYLQGKTQTVSEPQLIVWLVEALMRSKQNSYLALKEVCESPVLFPFIIQDVNVFGRTTSDAS